MKQIVSDTLILMGLAWIALNLSLFGIGESADKYLQDIISTHFTKVLYPYPPHEDITVVLLTDHALDNDQQQGRWPASYDYHGRILKDIARQNPKAIFIDFLWLSQRQKNEDGSYSDGNFLLKNIRELHARKVPVYLVAHENVKNNWPELEGYVIWVAAPLGFEVYDFVARRYIPKFDDLDTAAFRIAQDLYPELFSYAPQAPMDVIWSTHKNEKNHSWMDSDTPSSKTSISDILLKGHAEASQAIPFTRTLFVRDLLNPVAHTQQEVEEQLAYYLKDRIVLYGANLSGVSDLVFTPARTIQPGVYFHAMALDNLLNWGSNYKSNEGRGRSFLQSHAWVSMLATLPVAILIVLFHHLNQGSYQAPKSLRFLHRITIWGQQHPFQRTLAISASLFLWFGGVALFEFIYLNYSASTVAGYIKVVLGSYLIEKTATLEKIKAALKTVQSRMIPNPQPLPQKEATHE